jgi:hypothetical protein
VHDIVFAHPFLKPDNRGYLSLGKVEHLPAKPLAHGHRFLGRSEPVALVAKKPFRFKTLACSRRSAAVERCVRPGGSNSETTMKPNRLTTEEALRLTRDTAREKNWKRWGPYLSERQWATVREDYSAW